jgi:hypothetical protein
MLLQVTDAKAETSKVGILVQSSNDLKLKANRALFAAPKQLQDPYRNLIKFKKLSL